MAKRTEQTLRTVKSETKGAPMEDTTKKAQEYFTQSAGKAVESLTMWADANQRVLRELAELSAATAKESVRLYAELQSTTIEAFRDAHTTGLRWQAAWQDYAKDPMGWYQRALTDSVDGAQKAFRIIEGNAQAVTKSAERLQTTAEQAGKTIQETFSSVVTKMKDVYAA
jgi:hypothetical protein